MAAQPIRQTPPPAPHAPLAAHVHDDNVTPGWINDVRDAQKRTPVFGQGFGARSKKTAPMARERIREREWKPLSARAYLLTREECWDCKGSGKSGLILYKCPVCGIGWSWSQIGAYAPNGHVRDQWGAVRLPCSDACGKIPSNRIYRDYELCGICKGAGYLDELRNIDEAAQYIFDFITERLGISDATLPEQAVSALFNGSEPNAPLPHIPAHPSAGPAVGRVTPNLNPVSPHLPPFSPDGEESF